VTVTADSRLAARLGARSAPALTSLPDHTFPARKDSATAPLPSRYLEPGGAARLGAAGRSAGWLAELYRAAAAGPAVRQLSAQAAGRACTRAPSGGAVGWRRFHPPRRGAPAAS
jgi:hypothetical protein